MNTKEKILAALILILSAASLPTLAQGGNCGREFDGRTIPCDETPEAQEAREKRYMAEMDRQSKLKERLHRCGTLLTTNKLDADTLKRRMAYTFDLIKKPFHPNDWMVKHDIETYELFQRVEAKWAEYDSNGCRMLEQ